MSSNNINPHFYIWSGDVYILEDILLVQSAKFRPHKDWPLAKTD